GDRTEALRRLALPTLVIHGLTDTMCDPSGGRATAAAIPGAELVLIGGMGHNLPPALWERLADHIAQVVRRGEERATRGRCARRARCRLRTPTPSPSLRRHQRAAPRARCDFPAPLHARERAAHHASALCGPPPVRR